MDYDTGLSIFEFVDSPWFEENIQLFLHKAYVCIKNDPTGDPILDEFLKTPGMFTRYGTTYKEFICRAYLDFNQFRELYKKYLLVLTGKEEAELPNIKELRQIHKTISRQFLPVWINKKLNKPQPFKHIDNTDTFEDYDINEIRERYGIGKKRFTKEQEELAIIRRAIKEFSSEPYSDPVPDDYLGIPGIRALSPQDLELF